tara:strand:- start:1135 stop:1665 length:531 start_codon:yes stop_codon:yes gene_type:complete
MSTLKVNEIQNTSGNADITNVGKILQVQTTARTSAMSGSTSGGTSIEVMTVNITPISTSNKILVNIMCSNDTGGNHNGMAFIVTRDNTQIIQGDTASNRARVAASMEFDDSGYKVPTTYIQCIDSPSSTSQLTYALKFYDASANGGDYYINRDRNGGNNADSLRPVSFITVMEVAA